MKRFGIFALSCLISCILFVSVIAEQCDEDGNFPVEGQCDAYIQCRNGNAEEILCPDGLLFNPQDESSRPCQLPRRIPCEGKLQDPKPTKNCPRQYGLFYDGTPQECGLFKDCTKGVATFSKCTRALAFNPKTLDCDWPDLVPECDVETFLDFTCPPVDRQLAVGEVLKYKHEKFTSLYYMCLDGKPRLLDCGPRAYYDDTEERCIDNSIKKRLVAYAQLLEAQKLEAKEE